MNAQHKKNEVPNSAMRDGQEKIIVRGARTHNLKNITVEMPRNKMIAITGLSGSGKSSLAFDTIFAEGQRRYVESLSSYARQFLKQMQKPEVDEIIGLSPAISIDQKSRSNNPRSTVATITEIYDYLRVLYARIGRPFSPISGLEIRKLSQQEIINFVLDKVKNFDSAKNKTKVMGIEFNELSIQIFAPMVRGRKGEYYQMLYDMLGKGYEYALIDGELKSLREQIILSKNKKHNIDFLVDEILIHEIAKLGEDAELRLTESIEKALDEAEGLIKVIIGGPNTINKKKLKESEREEYLLSAKLLCPEDGFIFPEIEPRLFSFNSPYGACEACNGLGTKFLFSEDPCEKCGGARLRDEALHVFIGPKNKDGSLSKEKRKNIIEFVAMTIDEAYDFLASLELSEKEEEIARILIKEIANRLEFMSNVGLEYMALGRKANTLSGGEAQRIRLASQLGSQLVGALYVLDEPTIGLHPRDNARLISTLKELRDLGNTIIIVEHDEESIFASDYLVDIGPGAGRHGGEVIVADYLDKLLSAKTNSSKSRTLAYLRGEEEIPVPETRRGSKKGFIKIRGGALHNIRNLSVDIPLGKLIAITGVSGSGKSSFMHGILEKNLEAKLTYRHRSAKIINAKSFEIEGQLARVISIDQSPIGRTPRSNPATYTGAFTHIRDLFAETADAKVRGWRASRFSFNVKGGRCEACQGRGEIAVEMHFLPTVYVKCDVCDGMRFDKETLKVKFKGKSIFEVLEMTVEEAFEFFADIPSISDRLRTLMETGLGYLRLGQQANTLSGGESQRVKISSELYRPMTERTIYLLDEPTVGLHYDDVKKLISILNKLVERGNTVIVIEHNLDLVKNADYVFDFGPGGGVNGGNLVAKGTPEEIAHDDNSETGTFLLREFRKKRKK